jgi:hypothetical protein
MEKLCKTCGHVKPLEEFGKIKSGHRGKCKTCWSQYTRDYYAANPDARTARIAYNKQYRSSFKDKVFDLLGHECACCGESEEIFLTLDHVHNDGADHRRELGSQHGGSSTDKVWRWLVKNPDQVDRFQILCYNCNCGRRDNGGVCPHQK